MERREFLKAGTAAGLLSSAKILEPLARAERPTNNLAPIPKRALGKTGEKLSIIGFAGIVVMENGPSYASNIVAEAIGACWQNVHVKLVRIIEAYAPVLDFENGRINFVLAQSRFNQLE